MAGNSILVINAAGAETRVALVENGTIHEYYLERKREKGIVGNIYKGKVVRVLPGMQAAFVDIGLEKAAFLYVGDVYGDPDFSEEFELTEGEHSSETAEVPDEHEVEAAEARAARGEEQPALTPAGGIQLAPTPVPGAELSSLSGFVFDPRLMPAGEVHIVTEDDSATSATLAGIVASGIARRFDFRRVGFTVSRAPRAGVDNVLVGKRAFAAKTLGEAAVRPGKGGYLKVLPMRGAAGEADPTRAMLVVTGESDIAVKIAAITFANISFRFPGSDELEAFEFKLPEVEQYSGRETIRTDQTYSLKTLNFPTQSFVGINPGSRSITVSEGAMLDVDVALTPRAVSLSEIVVTGYGEQEAGNITGAATQVASEEFNTGRIVSPAQLIQSKVPGVQVVDNNEPGGGLAIRIRGQSSATASNEPLYVIDGMPVGTGSGGGLSVVAFGRTEAVVPSGSVNEIAISWPAVGLPPKSTV